MSFDVAQTPECAYLFLDTNTLLQFTTYDEVDWSKLVGVSETVLVIDNVVLRELDKFKNDQSNRGRRDRARTILKKLHGQLQGASQGSIVPIRPNVTVMAFLKARSVNLAADFLEPDIADDRLIAGVLQFGEDFPDRRLMLVSDDTSATFKAQQLGIEVIRPAEHLVRIEIADEADKAIRKLREELERERNRKPKLTLAFDGEGGPTHLLSVKYRKTANLKYDFSPIEEKVDLERRSVLRIVDLQRKLQPQFYERYLEEVECYAREYRWYLEALWYGSNAQNAALRIQVTNAGTSAASNIEIIVHSDEIRCLVDLEDPPYWCSNWRSLSPPVRPSVPESPFRASFEEYDGHQSAEKVGTTLRTTVRRPVNPHLQGIQTSLGTEPESWFDGESASIRVPTLSAGQSRTINAGIAFFEGPCKPARTLYYEIFAEQLDKPERGTLTLRFE